ncbi:MAG: YeeE/YedE family protein [Candidatus Omnitrophica bacterium]|nr:YeeE/YedE family protein [Candidatus Omnitrophota bacterium]
MNEQILGLITGILFGFLLQKGRVLRFDKQVGAMLFKDMTILKFMLSAIIVGMLGVYFLSDIGFIELKHKAMNVGAVLLGGSLFGAGWAVMGFCPGTSLGAIGEGRWHALWALLGMIAGAGIFAEMYPFFKSTVYTWLDWGKISLPELMRVNHWPVIAGLSVIYLFLFFIFEKRKI